MRSLLLLLLAFQLSCSPDAPEPEPSTPTQLDTLLAEHTSLTERVEQALADGSAMQPVQRAVTSSTAPRALQQLGSLGLPEGMTASLTGGLLTLESGTNRWTFRPREGQLVSRSLFVRLVDEALRDLHAPVSLVQPRISREPVVWALPRAEADALLKAHAELFEHPKIYRQGESGVVELSDTPFADPEAMASRLGITAESLPELGAGIARLAKRPDGAHCKGFGVFRWRVNKGHGVKRPDGTIVAPPAVRTLTFQPMGLEAVLKAGSPRPVTLADEALSVEMAEVLEAVGAELLAGHAARIPGLGTFTLQVHASALVFDRATGERTLVAETTQVVWLPEV